MDTFNPEARKISEAEINRIHAIEAAITFGYNKIDGQWAEAFKSGKTIPELVKEQNDLIALSRETYQKDREFALSKRKFMEGFGYLPTEDYTKVSVNNYRRLEEKLIVLKICLADYQKKYDDAISGRVYSTIQTAEEKQLSENLAHQISSLASEIKQVTEDRQQQINQLVMAGEWQDNLRQEHYISEE